MGEASTLVRVKVADVSHGENYRKVPTLPPTTAALLREVLRGYTPESANNQYLLEEEKLLASLPESITSRTAGRIVRLAQMVLSVAGNGLIHPPTVTPTPGAAHPYRVLAGERRWFAVRFLGWKDVTVSVRVGSPMELRVLRATENLQRNDPDPFEDGEEFDGFLREDKGLSQVRLASLLGRSVGFVSQRLSVFRKSSPALRQAFEDGHVNATDVRELCLLEEGDQKKALRRFTGAAGTKPDTCSTPTTKPSKTITASVDEPVFPHLDEALNAADLHPRSRAALLAGFNDLLACQLKMAKLTATQRAELRGKVWALEWVLGVNNALTGDVK